MKYKKPSIVEALCELTFSPETSWDSTVFGRLYERVKGNFPQREEREMFTATIVMSPQPTQPTPASHVQRAPRMVFSSGDRTRLMQVAERVLTINVLAPYPGWDAFRPMILDAMEVYRSVTEISEASQIVLRYLDRFEPEGPSFQLGDLLNCDGSLLPKELADQSLAIYQVRHPQASGGHFAVTAVCGPDATNTAAHNIILDTQIIRTGPLPLGEGSKALLEDMHDHIIDAFERSITQKLRERLEPLPVSNGARL